jgi:hypothetical protein
MIGAATEADRSAAVSDHWALSSEICSVRATDGISGAPRLLMIPVTIVTPTSTDTNRRVRCCALVTEADG